MAAYRTVSRLRDGTKLAHNVANVTGYEHARRAVVANVTNVRCVLVLVAEIASPGAGPEVAA